MSGEITPWIGTRKVLPVGDGGLAVLIPPKWARLNEIEKGSKVLVVADDRVTIEPCSPDRVEKVHKLLEDFMERDLGDDDE